MIVPVAGGGHSHLVGRVAVAVDVASVEGVAHVVHPVRWERPGDCGPVDAATAGLVYAAGVAETLRGTEGGELDLSDIRGLLTRRKKKSSHLSSPLLSLDPSERVRRRDGIRKSGISGRFSGLSFILVLVRS